MEMSGGNFSDEDEKEDISQNAETNNDATPEGEVEPFDSLLVQLREVVLLKEDENFATWYNGKGKETDAQSFKAIWIRAGVIAWHLRQEQNLQKGDRAILCYNFGLHFLESFFGCLRAGVVAVPVYPPNPAKLHQSLLKLTNIVEDCKPRLILIDSTIKKMRTINTSSLNLRSKSKKLWPQRIPYVVTDKMRHPKAVSVETLGFGNVATLPSDLAFLQYTSGSTGDPKGVMVTHGALKANVLLLRNNIFILDKDKYQQGADIQGFSWLPMHHDMGLVTATILPFTLGWRMHMMSPLSFLGNPLLWIDLMSQKKAIFSFAPDFAFGLVARKFLQAQAQNDGKCPIEEFDLSSLHYMICAAEPIRPETHKTFYELFAPFGLRREWFIAGYGLAESVVGVCHNPGSKMSAAREVGELPLVAVSSRERFDDTLALKIVDPNTCCELPENKTGEVWISGPSVAAGYYGKPELSKDVFHAKLSKTILPADQLQTFLRTGDLGFFQDNHLFICGRIKDIIIVNGVNYYPQDVEFAVQTANPAVRPGCVAAFASNETKDGHLEIVFEIRAGKEKLAFEVIDAIRIAVTRNTGLAPTRVVAITEKSIPKTTSGKIQRRASRKALHDGKLDIVFDWHSDEVIQPSRLGASVSPRSIVVSLDEVMEPDQFVDSIVPRSSIASAISEEFFEASESLEGKNQDSELYNGEDREIVKTSELSNEDDREIEDVNESFKEQNQDMQLYNEEENKIEQLANGDENKIEDANESSEEQNQVLEVCNGEEGGGAIVKTNESFEEKSQDSKLPNGEERKIEQLANEEERKIEGENESSEEQNQVLELCNGEEGETVTTNEFFEEQNQDSKLPNREERKIEQLYNGEEREIVQTNEYQNLELCNGEEHKIHDANKSSKGKEFQLAIENQPEIVAFEVVGEKEPDLQTVREAIARVLEIDYKRINTSQSLAELGISSIAAMEVAEAMSSMFSVEVPIELLYEASSLEMLYTSLKDVRNCDPSTMKAAQVLDATNSPAADESPPVMVWYEYLLLWVLSLLFRWTWKLSSRNTHQIPDESIILAVNHLTHWDSVMVAGLLPSRSMACKLRVVSKAEHFSSESNPLFKFIATLLRAIPLSRENTSSRIEALHTCISSLQCGRSILIHPEGTRSRDGTLLEFHEGIAHLSRQTGCKVVPCYISNAAHGAWPPSRSLPHLFSSNPVSVVFGAPISLSDKAESDQAFTKRLRNSMLDLAHGLGEYPEFNGIVSASLSGALECQGIQKADAERPSAMGFSISLKPSSVRQVQEAVNRAKFEGRKITPMGSGWSRGGQAFISTKSPSMALDMTNMNKISDIDVDSKTAIVQAGAKWADVRKALATHGLAPLATQSYDVFTVGGSISANAHGRSLDTSTVAGGVLSITLVNCNGDVVLTKPDEDLFKAVCGGFGLLGIIVEVKLQLTSDSVYTTELRVLPTSHYAECFDRDKLIKRSVHFQFARLSCIPGSLFENVIWETCMEVKPDVLSSYSGAIMEGSQGQGLVYNFQKFTIWALRTGKQMHLLQRVRWALETSYRQGRVGRLQRRNTTQQEDFGALLPWDGHLLEVFIPCAKFIEFIDVARSILESPTAPTLLNATIRWVGKDTKSILSYSAGGSCFSMVLFMKAKAKANGDSIAATARKLYDAAISVDGSFYLTYEPWHTEEQRKRAYPGLPKWLEQKERFDPKRLFQSTYFSEVLSRKEKIGPSLCCQQFPSPSTSLGEATNDAGIDSIVDVGPSLSKDAILEWLADIGNHVAWHGAILFQARSKIVVAPIWLPIVLLLVAVFGNVSLLFIVSIVVLYQNTYEIELRVPTSEVRVASLFVERLFAVQPAGGTGENSSFVVSVSVNDKGFRWVHHRQLKDADLILFQMKQLSDHVHSFQQEEATVAACQSGAFVEKVECTTKDGSMIKLTRVKKIEDSNENRSAVFFGGYAASALTTGSLQLVPHLHREGFSDVWLVETRISSEMSGVQCNRTLDDVALYDVPCTIAEIRKRIGSANPLHVIANCMGALSVSMSLAAGATSEQDVTTLTVLNVALTPTVKYQRKLEWVLSRRIFGLNRGTELSTILTTEGRRQYSEVSFGHRLFEFILQRFHTHQDGVMANNGLIHARYAGLSSAITSAVFHDGNLAPSTRKAMAGYHLGGKVHHDLTLHMIQMQSETGTARARRYSPASAHHIRVLPEDYLEAFSMLRIPVFGFVGSKNELFGESLCDTFAYLNKERPDSCIQKATVVPGFGHMDLFMSPAARTSWLTQMTEQVLLSETKRFVNGQVCFLCAKRNRHHSSR